MDSKKEKYEIEFTEDARDEIKEIYRYISENLVAEKAAMDLMRKMKNAILNLAESPELYMKIERKYNGKRDFRRIVIDNYVVLYNIDSDKKKVYIAHMYYGRKNYF